MFGALVWGGELVVVPFLTSRSPDAFLELLVTKKVTVLNQTPSAFIQLTAALHSCASFSRLHKLRLVIFGGEALNVGALERWLRGYPDVQLVNMYGITETTVHVTHRVIQAADLSHAWVSPIGEAIPYLRLYVLDEDLDLCPVGVAGEIYIAGKGLARGYHGRPALTAERFIPDPFSGEVGSRLYKSGDLARRRAAGQLEYLGRADGQVKVRGHRIELGEIEASLCRHAAISGAVVLPAVDSSGHQQLLAWVTTADNVHIDQRILREHVRESLPDYMVPSRISLLDRLPLTTNGKMDKRALLELKVEHPDSHGDHVEARSERERKLAEVWKEVLELERVSVNDSFFALGGDSIRAVQVTHVANRRGLPFKVVDLFRSQTIAELALTLDADSAVRPPDGAANLSLFQVDASVLQKLPKTASDPYPVTGMQELMLRNHSRDEPNRSGLYHVQQTFRIADDQACAESMRAALEQVAAAHPVLRTRIFATSDDSFVQWIAADSHVPMSTIDISNMTEPGQNAFLAADMLDDRARPFGAEASPLWRMRWYWTSAQSFALLLSIHHAIDDGWGNQYFLDELFRTYARLRAGGEPWTHPHSNVFKEYVALEREMRNSTVAKLFWRAMEQDFCGPLPCRDEVVRDGSYTETLDRDALTALQVISREFSVQSKTIALVCYANALRAQFGDKCRTIGVVTNGRSARLSDPLRALGLFWNMTPFYLSRFATRSEHEMLSKAQAFLSSAEEYSLYPLLDICEQRPVEELFFATFNFTDFHNRTDVADMDGLKVIDGESLDRFHFPLNLLVALDRRSGTVYLHTEYDRRFVSDATAEAVTSRMRSNLVQLAERLKTMV